MPVEVRRAVPDNAAAIAAVHVPAWQVAYRGLIPDETLDHLSVEQRADVPAVYVAVKGGVTVGFCAVAALGQDDGVAEIGAIYVERRFGSADSRCRSKLECSNRETFS